MTNANRTLIITLGAIGVSLVLAFVAIVIFYNGDKALVLAGLISVAGLIIPQLLSLKASTENAVRLEAVDQKLTESNAKTSKKLDENTAKTELTHMVVNSRMDEFIKTMKDLAETQNKLASAQSLAQGITIGRGQTGHESEAGPDAPPPVSPSDAAAVGAAQAVQDTPIDALPGVVADAAARGAAEATKA